MTDKNYRGCPFDELDTLKQECPEQQMDTPKINRLLMLLVRQGKLSVDRANTSTSTGTCYRLTKQS